VTDQRNPVVRAFHNGDDLPVGVTISLDVTSDGEIASWKWAGR
jgi:hypothetical protein